MPRFDLKDATAIVTGGSRGIGPHVAGALAQCGARIALVARSEQGLEATARTLTANGLQVITITADVTSAEDRHAIVQTTERELGPVDVLVNNAGGDLQREFHNLTETDIEGVLDLNLTSAVILSRLVLPGMLARGHGHIVNVSSMAGRTSFPLTEAYAAAKDGLIGFTRVLRGDYRRRGVSGSTLILGPVRDAGAGVSTAQEVGIKAPSGPLTVSPARVARATVRAIVKDKAELAVMPGPGRMLRAIMDRFPGIGPAMNHAAGIDKTMLTIAEFREREARLAADRPERSLILIAALRLSLATRAPAPTHHTLQRRGRRARADRGPAPVARHPRAGQRRDYKCVRAAGTDYRLASAERGDGGNSDSA